MTTKDGSLALVGAGVGAVLGYFVFQHFLSRGHILLVAPGALLGVGRALFSRTPSNLLGLICAVAGLGLSTWIANTLYVNGLEALNRRDWLSILVGGGFAFWFGRGRGSRGYASSEAQE
jgi:hypothetical protein